MIALADVTLILLERDAAPNWFAAAGDDPGGADPVRTGDETFFDIVGPPPLFAFIVVLLRCLLVKQRGLRRVCLETLFVNRRSRLDGIDVDVRLRRMPLGQIAKRRLNLLCGCRPSAINHFDHGIGSFLFLVSNGSSTGDLNDQRADRCSYSDPGQRCYGARV